MNRGGPSGFWEVLNKDPSSGFIIQKLNNELDGGEILVRGNLMTRDLWLLNNASLLAKANIFMKKLLLHIAVNAEVPQSEGVRLHGKILYKISSNSILFKYIIKTLVPKIFSSLSSKYFSPIVTRWSVAYAHHEGFSKSLWRYNEIENPPGRFLADLFVFEHDGAHFIFVEDLFYSDNKGRISAIRLGDDDHEFLGVVWKRIFICRFHTFSQLTTIFL
ncbi:hypothetical protein N9D73_00800 [Planktomarina temperata]|nr:hypothetical protein [Planktomarina temperata]